MNKPHIYRIWSKTERRYIDTYYKLFGSLEKAVNLQLPDIENLIIEEWIGAEDANGVKVFEGDLVIRRFPDVDDPNNLADTYSWADKYWLVIWDNNEHRWGLSPAKGLNHGAATDHISAGTRIVDIQVADNVLARQIAAEKACREPTEADIEDIIIKIPYWYYSYTPVQLAGLVMREYKGAVNPTTVKQLAQKVYDKYN